LREPEGLRPEVTWDAEFDLEDVLRGGFQGQPPTSYT
jgi:hypothetical protein